MRVDSVEEHPKLWSHLRPAEPPPGIGYAWDETRPRFLSSTLSTLGWGMTWEMSKKILV